MSTPHGGHPTMTLSPVRPHRRTTSLANMVWRSGEGHQCRPPCDQAHVNTLEGFAQIVNIGHLKTSHCLIQQPGDPALGGSCFLTMCEALFIDLCIIHCLQKMLSSEGGLNVAKLKQKRRALQTKTELLKTRLWRWFLRTDSKLSKPTWCESESSWP